ncbi:MAG: LacI family DNA-binding transcriptional regulator [Planctomycetota bacterium]|jgi:LacI family repressor for deo operon, udp, cdd, tsx, nupC, and nupG
MGLNIERNGVVPRYLQIKLFIKQEYGVSYLTVRRAIGELVDEGLLYRRRGRGTFVAERGRISRKTRNVGFVFSERQRHGLADPYFCHVFDGLESECRRHDYALFCSTWPEQLLPMEAEGAGQPPARKVDGIVVGSIGDGDERIVRMSRFVPVVLLHGVLDDPRIPAVIADNTTAAGEATRHLLSLGHRRIAHVTGPLDCLDGRQRLEGYTAALAAAGLPDDPGLIVEGEFEFESGRQAVDRLMSPPAPPTALFCANDTMALGAMQRLREGGLSVPGDVSVMGVDDIGAASQCHPPLTTVSIPKEQIGSTAFSLLRDMIESDRRAAVEPVHVVPVKLIVRQSTGPPNGGPTA